MDNLSSLPHEIICMLYGHLMQYDAARLSLTSSTFYQTAPEYLHHVALMIPTHRKIKAIHAHFHTLSTDSTNSICISYYYGRKNHYVIYVRPEKISRVRWSSKSAYAWLFISSEDNLIELITDRLRTCFVNNYLFDHLFLRYHNSIINELDIYLHDGSTITDVINSKNV